MTVEDYTWHRCWNPKSVGDVIVEDVANIMEDDKAVFLAANVPLPVTLVKGEKGHENAGLTILEELTADDFTHENNHLIVVEGISGCGKTHLVRWVYSNLKLDESKFCLIYIPKELNSLKDVLKKLLDKLPATAAVTEVREAVETSIGQKRPLELVEDVYYQLHRSLSWRTPAQPPDASSWDPDDLKV